MGKLSLDLGKDLDRVDVLTANQVAMHHHNMGQLRKQQQRDAEAKVVFSVCFLAVFFSIVKSESRLSLALSNTPHILGL